MLRVLTYHRISYPGHPPYLSPRLISATPETFERQIRHLARNYNVVSIRALLESVQKETPLPGRPVLLTFDDGYRDFATFVWPVLKRYEMPVTLFVPTAYPDQPERTFWWDRLYQGVKSTPESHISFEPFGTLSLKTPELRRKSLCRIQNHVKSLSHDEAMRLIDQLCARLNVEPAPDNGVLSWDELCRLSQEGVTIGAHTRTHPIMTQLSPGLLREEIVGAQEDLRRKIGSVLPIFCYPNGNHNERVVAALKEEGFILAFTTTEGGDSLKPQNLLHMRRTNIGRRTSPLIFRLRMNRFVSMLTRTALASAFAKASSDPL